MFIRLDYQDNSKTLALQLWAEELRQARPPPEQPATIEKIVCEPYDDG